MIDGSDARLEEDAVSRASCTGGMHSSRVHRVTIGCTLFIVVLSSLGAQARDCPRIRQQQSAAESQQQGSHARQLAQTDGVATVTNGAELAAALAGSAFSIELSGECWSEASRWARRCAYVRPSGRSAQRPQYCCASVIASHMQCFHVLTRDAVACQRPKWMACNCTTVIISLLPQLPSTPLD